MLAWLNSNESYQLMARAYPCQQVELSSIRNVHEMAKTRSQGIAPDNGSIGSLLSLCWCLLPKMKRAALGRPLQLLSQFCISSRRLRKSMIKGIAFL